MKNKVEKLIVDWLKSDNENTTHLTNQIFILLDINSSVFILQHKETRRIHGCFDAIDKAEKYANNSTNIEIVKIEIV